MKWTLNFWESIYLEAILLSRSLALSVSAPFVRSYTTHQGHVWVVRVQEQRLVHTCVLLLALKSKMTQVNLLCWNCHSHSSKSFIRKRLTVFVLCLQNDANKVTTLHSYWASWPVKRREGCKLKRWPNCWHVKWRHEEMTSWQHSHVNKFPPMNAV